MKIPKIKMPFAAFPTVFLPALASPHFPGHPVFAAVCISTDLVFLVWTIASYIATGDYIGSGLSRKQKKAQLREKMIRELEKDNGYEPLDLDWPEGLIEEMKKSPRKEM